MSSVSREFAFQPRLQRCNCFKNKLFIDFLLVVGEKQNNLNQNNLNRNTGGCEVVPAEVLTNGHVSPTEHIISRQSDTNALGK
jgi:hypothetical protein